MTHRRPGPSAEKRIRLDGGHPSFQGLYPTGLVPGQHLRQHQQHRLVHRHPQLQNSDPRRRHLLKTTRAPTTRGNRRGDSFACPSAVGESSRRRRRLSRFFWGPPGSRWDERALAQVNGPVKPCSTSLALFQRPRRSPRLMRPWRGLTGHGASAANLHRRAFGVTSAPNDLPQRQAACRHDPGRWSRGRFSTEGRQQGLRTLADRWTRGQPAEWQPSPVPSGKHTIVVIS